MHHLFLKRSENPDSGPLSSVPAIGCDEIQDTFLGIFFSINKVTFFFTDPTSVSIAPFFKELFIFKIIFF